MIYSKNDVGYSYEEDKDQIEEPNTEKRPSDSDDIYNYVTLYCLYLCYLCLVLLAESIIMTIVVGEEHKKFEYIGIFNNLYNLVNNTIKDYHDARLDYNSTAKNYLKDLNSILKAINKNEELRTRFDELYKSNKHLLKDPEALLNKTYILLIEFNREENKGKLKSLKRY